MSARDIEGLVGDWRDMALAPRIGEILLLLGETIPDHADARAGTYLSGDEADELGYREFAKYGCWMIWHDAGDWFCVDESAPLSWLPLPGQMPRKHRVIDQSDARAILRGSGEAG